MSLHDEEAYRALLAQDAGMTSRKQKKPILTNHTVYGEGGENYEHDDTGSLMNFSGCADDALNARADNDGWEEGYDY